MSESPKLITTFWPPPIPDRRWDWCAYIDGEEEARRYGWGRTEAEAISDYHDNYYDDEE